MGDPVPGIRVAGREVGMEAGVLPVRHADHDLVLDVLHDLLPGLGHLRRGGREKLTK